MKQIANKRLPPDRHDLVLDNTRLIHYVLKKMGLAPRLLQDYEDYYQIGCIGLIKAATNFDESRGFKFSTYAIPMISGEIRRERRDKGTTVKYSRHFIDLRYKLGQYLSTVGDSKICVDDILKELNISNHEYLELINMGSVQSLDELIDIDSVNTTFGDLVADPIDGYLASELATDIERALTKILNKASEIYKDIYEEYIYSMELGEKLNQEYFAIKYNVSQAQISRILKKFNKMLQCELSYERGMKSIPESKSMYDTSKVDPYLKSKLNIL